MTITLPDDILKETGLTDREALIEFACSLFDAGFLELWPAARLADLDRMSFENELRKRKISIFRPTLADIEIDAQTIRSLEP